MCLKREGLMPLSFLFNGTVSLLAEILYDTDVKRLLRELPLGVELVAAAKGRRPEDVVSAVDAGVKMIGENYFQEAERLYTVVSNRVVWHFIGHLQKNKVKKAVSLFDMIETVDSFELASEIDSKCREINKMMPVLIEVNSGREPQKHGVFPENAASLVNQISCLKQVKVIGLMTMGPVVVNQELVRRYFKETRRLFERLQELNLPNVEMKYLSMGMSDSYRIAIEEGANIIRIGSKIFED
jgi:pyridoxal phosphate enzyme (YggS family)